MLDQGRQVRDAEGGVGLAGGGKILFDAQMDFEGAGFEPGAAALGQVFGFGDFGNAQDAGIKGTRP